VIDANGHSTKYKYDILGNLTEVHRFGEISEETIQRMYDDINVDNKPAVFITKYEYDKRNLITKEINLSGFVTEYKYDKLGNLIAKIDRDGFNTTFEKILLFKNIFTVLAWILVVVVIPIIYLGKSIDLITLITMLQIFLIILCSAITSDINDIDGDIKNSIKTVPAVLGKKKTLIIEFILNTFAILFYFLE